MKGLHARSQLLSILTVHHFSKWLSINKGCLILPQLGTCAIQGGLKQLLSNHHRRLMAQDEYLTIFREGWGQNILILLLQGFLAVLWTVSPCKRQSIHQQAWNRESRRNRGILLHSLCLKCKKSRHHTKDLFSIFLPLLFLLFLSFPFFFFLNWKLIEFVC